MDHVAVSGLRFFFLEQHTPCRSITAPRFSSLEHASADSRPMLLGNSGRLIRSDLLFAGRLEASHVVPTGSWFVKSSIRSHPSSVCRYKSERCGPLNSHQRIPSSHHGLVIHILLTVRLQKNITAIETHNGCLQPSVVVLLVRCALRAAANPDMSIQCLHSQNIHPRFPEESSTQRVPPDRRQRRRARVRLEVIRGYFGTYSSSQ